MTDDRQHGREELWRVESDAGARPLWEPEPAVVETKAQHRWRLRWYIAITVFIVLWWVAMLIWVVPWIGAQL